MFVVPCGAWAVFVVCFLLPCWLFAIVSCQMTERCPGQPHIWQTCSAVSNGHRSDNRSPPRSVAVGLFKFGDYLILAVSVFGFYAGLGTMLQQLHGVVGRVCDWAVLRGSCTQNVTNQLTIALSQQRTAAPSQDTTPLSQVPQRTQCCMSSSMGCISTAVPVTSMMSLIYHDDSMCDAVHSVGAVLFA
eukprot:jgi/Chrzof1/14297/Cz08g32030.t1